MIINNLILGTAQLNSNYGINNKNLSFCEEDAFNLLDLAKLNNIKILDTALNYKNSYKIIEKFCDKNFNDFSIIDKVDSKSVFNFAKSKSPIHWPWLYEFINNGGDLCLMLHNGDDYLNIDIRKNLQKCKELNMASSIGISIYETEKIEKFINIGGLDVIQLPWSLINRKKSNIDLINKLKDANIAVHIRSIFHQGLLLSMPLKLPDNFIEYKKSYTDFCKIAHSVEKRIALSIASVLRDVSGSLIVGADNVDQLKIIIKAHKIAYDLPNKYVKKSRKIWENMPDHIIDPRKWIINS